MTIRRGVAAEADQAVDGQPGELPERVLGPAGLAGGAIVFQAHLPETHEAPEAADEPAPLGEAVERIDHAAVHQAEVAAVERDVQLADPTQGPIERPISQPLERPFPAVSAGPRRRRRTRLARAG